MTPSLVEKTLGSVRAGTKKKGTELCLMYVEVENTAEGVIVSCSIRSSQSRVTEPADRCSRGIGRKAAKGRRWINLMFERDHIVSEDWGMLLILDHSASVSLATSR